MPDEIPTANDVPHGPPGRLVRVFHGAGVALLVGVVLAAAVGLLGPRTAETSGRGGGYELNLTYPAITRSGQPTVLELVLQRPGGFDGKVTVQLCQGFFNDLDFQNWYPNPSAETAIADAITYEFDPPPGDELRITLDARVAPGQFGGIDDCRVSILENDQSVAHVDFTSWRMP